MDFQRLFDSLQQQFRSFRWNTQTVAVLLLACFALIGIIAVQRPLSSNIASHVSLFDGRRIAFREMQQIEAALGKADLTDYAVEDGQLKVPRTLRSKYYAALQEASSLPQSFHSPTQEALSAGGTFETIRKSQQRMHHALEQEARLAICELSGIEDAFVFFDEKTDRSTRTLQSKKRVSAVVGVRTTLPDQPLDLQSYQVIRDMVLAFKVELTEDDITITDLNARQAFRGSLSQADSPRIQALARQGLEREWKKKIGDALAFVPEAQINVRVVPDSLGTQAKSVRVSIGIPSTYLQRIVPAGTDAEMEAGIVETRQKIQSTVQPLLPDSLATAGQELVAVNVFDVVASPENEIAAWPNVSRSLLTLGLTVALVLSGWFLVVTSLGHQPKESSPSLRVYGSESAEIDATMSRRGDGPVVASRAEESHVGSETADSSAAKLRAYVEEDPAAAAQSLSDFIDRAS